MVFWFKNKYDSNGVYLGRLIVRAETKEKAGKKMSRIESKWNNGLHSGKRIRGPYATMQRAKTIMS